MEREGGEPSVVEEKSAREAFQVEYRRKREVWVADRERISCFQESIPRTFDSIQTARRRQDIAEYRYRRDRYFILRVRQETFTGGTLLIAQRSDDIMRETYAREVQGSRAGEQIAVGRRRSIIPRRMLIDGRESDSISRADLAERVAAQDRYRSRMRQIQGRQLGIIDKRQASRDPIPILYSVLGSVQSIASLAVILQRSTYIKRAIPRTPYPLKRQRRREREAIYAASIIRLVLPDDGIVSCLIDIGRKSARQDRNPFLLEGIVERQYRIPSRVFQAGREYFYGIRVEVKGSLSRNGTEQILVHSRESRGYGGRRRVDRYRSPRVRSERAADIDSRRLDIEFRRVRRQDRDVHRQRVASRDIVRKRDRERDIAIASIRSK